MKHERINTQEDRLDRLRDFTRDNQPGMFHLHYRKALLLEILEMLDKEEGLPTSLKALKLLEIRTELHMLEKIWPFNGSL